MTPRNPTIAVIGLAGACALLFTLVARADEARPVITDREILKVIKPDNWIHNENTGLRFRLPDGWYAKSLLPAGDGANSIVLAIPERAPGANAMFTQGARPPAEPSGRDGEALLRDQARARETGRLTRTPSYRNRAGSFAFRKVNGQPALAWFADYDRDGVKWSEYVVRVLGPGSFGALVIRAPADRIESLQVSADALIDTLELP